ncbi:PilZ domain-containing protein [Reinekea sp.]|uniref:PilZ domain-containing protein n=1 Tax=Reinekea sp. TaxID=1970455 RepID=UPI002A821DC7|nr:PilZ domain-containing protein [Reinekea sp.]
MDDNKRRFQRIPFDAQIRLTLTDESLEPITGILQDISLKGALIAVSEAFAGLEIGQLGALQIRPDQGDIELNLTVEVAYALTDRHAYGLNLVSLDLESASHLRRLIEVNLGSDDGLQRELSNLIEAMEEEHSSL